jgi:hypothetical protein
MNNYYLHKIQKIKYKNYEIDDIKNLFIFDNLFEIQKLSNLSGLDYIATGSCAIVLHSNKIYRSLNDLDLVINIKDLYQWINIINKIYNFNFIGEPVEYFEYCLNEDRLLSFSHKKNKMNLDICVVSDNHPWNPKKILNKEINDYKYNYCLPLKMKKTNKSFYNRDIDSDDMDFYSEFLY